MKDKRLTIGFLWGFAATLAMSVVMLLGQFAGIAPMPQPIPATIMGKIFGAEAPKPLLMLLALIAHFGYGGIWGAVLARLTQPVTVAKGLAMGLFLWLIMQIIVLPAIGWGLFGSAITLQISLATLLLHLVYGATLGWLLDRGSVAAHRSDDPVGTQRHTH